MPKDMVNYNESKICESDGNKLNNNTEIDEKRNLMEIKSITKQDLANKERFTKYLEEMNSKFLEQFELQEMVGSGSESYVYRTAIRKSKRIIASKILFKKDEEESNIYKELTIAKKLKNKNIINIYGGSTIVKDELDCIAMEYSKYGNLRDFQRNILKRNILSEQLLCYIIYQILTGLKYCHQCKIAHFDLKPQNITVDDYLNFKIIDFSISLDYSKITSKTIKLPFRGTSFYIAPEVISSKSIDVKDLNKVDLYSLGVILYNLAFGQYPYNLSAEDAKDYDKIYEKIQGDWEIKNDDHFYSEYFIDFVKKLLEKDINKRININQAMNHYWVKGAKILNDEKEKIYHCGNFLSYLLTDYFKSFGDYISHK